MGQRGTVHRQGPFRGGFPIHVPGLEMITYTKWRSQLLIKFLNICWDELFTTNVNQKNAFLRTKPITRDNRVLLLTEFVVSRAQCSLFHMLSSEERNR